MPLGLNIQLPRVHTENGTTFVDPLRIGVVPSPTRDQIAGTVIGGAQPLRQAIFQFMLDNASCDTNPAPLILAADIVTLSITGGGSFNLNFGGTQAQTKNIPAPKNDFVGSNAPGVSPGQPVAAPAYPPSVGVLDGSLDTPTPEFLEPDGTRGNSGRQALRAAESKDEGDNALLLALVVLALGALLIQGDLARMRRVDRARGDIS